MDEPVGVPDPASASDSGALLRAVRALTAEIAELQAECADRHLLDLATGVLVAQLSVPPADAADHLRRLVAQTGLGTRDVAADIVNAAAGTAAAAGADPAAPRRLRRTDAAVTAAATAGQAAAALLDAGLGHLGAQEVWLWRRTATDCLQLAAQAGGSTLASSHWQWLLPQLGGALRAALDHGEARWLPDGPPPDHPLPGPAPDAGRAVLPLRHKGSVTGVLLVCWPGPVVFDPPVVRAVEAVGDTAAVVLDADPGPEGPGSASALGALLDCLGEAALVLLRPEGAPDWSVGHANPMAARQLAEVPRPVGRVLAEVLPAHCAELARLVEQARAAAAPRRADRLSGRDGAALVDVRALPLGPGRCVVLWHPSDDASRLLPRVLDRLDRLALFEEDLVSGVSRWSERAYEVFGVERDAPPVPLWDLMPRIHPDDKGGMARLLERLTVHQEGAQALVRVVREDGGLRHVRISAEPLLQGAVTAAVTGVFQDVSDRYRTELALGASFDQLTAMEAQAAVRRQFVRQLQQAIVPEVPDSLSLPGLLASARYRPAAQDYKVGGDWYDVLPLGGGRVMLAVGDIAGHGIESATAMVALRNALRGLAYTGAAAGQLMGWLNDVALAAPGHPTATAVCALYEPRERVLRWASAGHPPLVLLREGRASRLEPPHDILLGAVPSVSYTETATALRPGDLLVLYTDGLVERRHSPLDEGVSLLMTAVEQLADAGIEEQADRLLTGARENTDDDTSLVLVRVAQ
ncbi:SpoIIE family protein phosphatase [Streptomyces sp. NPDC044571]|uniref:SpoIIE family protein phosphatase n=1 Tax=Streptomyces sp. NPDC044571 TaxID=3155371 RepID=UPI00340B8DF6